MIILGKYRNRGICRIDAKKEPFYMNVESIEDWSYIKLFHENEETQESHFVGIPPKCNNQIFINGFYIPQRTCKLKTRVAISIISNYDAQLKHLINEVPKNVRYILTT